MHEIVYYLAMIWLTGLLCACIWQVIRTPWGMARILGLDTLTLIVISLLIMYSTTKETSFYLDAALLLAFISFVSTIVLSRYHSEHKIF